ncbi:MAG TPA: hypothetical protein VGF48_25540 [Thermoanaerobaculia bacterium]|jgi:hypothetical protein
MRNITVVLLLTLAVTAGAAAPKKKTPPRPVTHAPQQLPHSIATFLRTLSSDGSHQVTFKATAYGHRFFFEEPSGVTVYRFENGDYVRAEFLRGVKLQAAVKRYMAKAKK